MNIAVIITAWPNVFPEKYNLALSRQTDWISHYKNMILNLLSMRDFSQAWVLSHDIENNLYKFKCNTV